MPGRFSTSGDYRYGYNGMEMDNETSGNGNSYTTEFRQYDPRLMRWKSLDPLMAMFPWMSPYVAFDNNPIYYIDPYGLESNGNNKGKRKGESADDPQIIKEVKVVHKRTFQQKLAFLKKQRDEKRLARSQERTLPKETSNSDNLGGRLANYPSPMETAQERQIREQREAEEAEAYILAKHGEFRQGGVSDQYKLAQLNGEIYDGVFSVVIPGRDLLKSVINGEEITADAIIMGGIEFIPIGKLFSKGGKLFARVMKNGSVVTEDVTNAVVKLGCFVEGTPISTENGLKPIEEIEVGDKVWAFDEFTGTKDLKLVYNTTVKELNHLDKLVIGSDTIYTTDDHPFWVSDSWKKAGELECGDTLTLRNGEYALLSYKERIDTTVIVYNFAVEDYHSYYVGEHGVLVHNNNGCSAAITKKTAAEIAKSCKKMTEAQITQFLGKGWHQNGAKTKLIKKHLKELKGSTNADLFINPSDGEILLKGNKTGTWVRTGLYNK